MGRKTSTEDLIRELETGGVLGTTRSSAPVAPKTSRSLEVSSPTSTSGLLFFVVAAVIVAVLGSLPVVSIGLYPFGLFVTLLHETSHAVAALVTGGSVGSLTLYSDRSGLTTANGIEAIVASAGYLGATAAGVGLLLTPLRHARWALAGLAGVPLLALLLFHPGSLFTAVWCAVFLVALALAAWKLPARIAAFLQIFLGVEAGLNAFRDVTDLVLISGTNSHIHTDAVNMSNALFGPPILWAVLWAVLSVVLLLAALVIMVRRDLPTGRVRRKPVAS